MVDPLTAEPSPQVITLISTNDTTKKISFILFVKTVSLDENRMNRIYLKIF
jgi:hypothetical protein